MVKEEDGQGGVVGSEDLCGGQAGCVVVVIASGDDEPCADFQRLVAQYGDARFAQYLRVFPGVAVKFVVAERGIDAQRRAQAFKMRTHVQRAVCVGAVVDDVAG